MSIYKYFVAFFITNIFFKTIHSQTPEIICHERILRYATEQFLHDTSPQHGINPDHYYTYIAQAIADGGYYSYLILTNTYPEKLCLTTQHEYLQTLIAITWYLYAEELIAGTTDLGFIEGAFIIQDPQKRLFNFFKGYVDFIELQGYSIYWAWGLVAANPFAYKRQATHMPHEHFGIDIPHTSSYNHLLFGGKKHLLFSHYTCPYNMHHFYLKPENHGLALGIDLIHHTKELCYSKLRLRHNQPNYRKERIHKEIRSKIHALCQNIHNASIRKDIQMAGNKSISSLIQKLDKYKEYLIAKEPWTINAINTLENILQNNYTHIKQRIGNEVYIASIDLILSSYFYFLQHENRVEAPYYKELLESFYKVKTNGSLYRYARETCRKKPSITTLLTDTYTFIEQVQAFSYTLPITIESYFHSLQAQLTAHIHHNTLEQAFLSSCIFEEHTISASV